MKKMFTQITGSLLLSALLLTGLNGNAQTTSAPTTTFANADAKTEKKPDATATTEKSVKKDDPADTSWKPQRRLWGYTFGDFYYDQHSPLITSTQGKENNYYQTPSNRNAFQFRRIYLGYDYDITKKFKAEFLLASEPSANTGTTTSAVGGVNGTTSVNNGDNLADNKMGFFIKNINLRVREVWTGTDFVIGEMSTPGFALNEPGTNAPTSLSEATWSYRSIERTITDFHKNNSYDIGASLQGTFDPATKNFGYVVMVGDNSTSSLLSAANANTGFYKMVYGDIWGKFFNQHLYVDIYADYLKTAGNSGPGVTPAIGPQNHNMWKGFVAYTTPVITLGAEGYIQKIANGVTNKATVAGEDATVKGLSLWVRGSIVKSKLGYFARYDNYNPDSKINADDAYAVNTNYSSYDPTVKQSFYTFGLDFTPAKNIHFMPNVWLDDYKSDLASTTAGYLAPDHTLVYRMTFFFTFGK